MNITHHEKYIGMKIIAPKLPRCIRISSGLCTGTTACEQDCFDYGLSWPEQLQCIAECAATAY